MLDGRRLDSFGLLENIIDVVLCWQRCEYPEGTIFGVKTKRFAVQRIPFFQSIEQF